MKAKAEKVERLRVRRAPGYYYFLRAASVFRVRMKGKGSDIATRVCDGDFQRANRWTYFLDAAGDVSRVKR